MLYIINYSNLNSLFIVTLFLLELSLIVMAVFVINSKNPIVSILYLIGLFLLVSIYLIIIGLDFIGISYLLVYIGAVSILFLFILMLIDIRISELYKQTMNNFIIATIIGLYLYNVINTIFSSTYDVNNSILNINKLQNNFLQFSTDHVNNITHNTWEGFIVENIDIVGIGNIIYTNLSLWLIISLLILLLSMVGAIVINLDNKSLMK